MPGNSQCTPHVAQSPLLPSLQSSPRSPKALSKLPLPAPSLAEDPDSHPFSQQRQSPSSRHLNPHSHRQPQARSSGCQDQRQSTLYLRRDSRRVLLLLLFRGLVKPAPPGKGLSANSSLHHRGSGIPAPPSRSQPWPRPTLL